MPLYFGENKLSSNVTLNQVVDVKTLLQTVSSSIGDIGTNPLFIDDTNTHTRKLLNGQWISLETYSTFYNKLLSVKEKYPSLCCTLDEWNAIATASVVGQCGKFVIDTNGKRIKLPKIVMPIQGLTDFTKLGEMVSQELPNITGDIRVVNEYNFDNTSVHKIIKGAFEVKTFPTAIGSNIQQNTTPSGDGVWDVTFDASRSSTAYKTGGHVQQEQVRYPYYIQLSIGIDMDLENVKEELCTINPYSLFDSKYSINDLTNASWLKSLGQKNSGNTYPAAYKLLLDVYEGRKTIKGVEIICNDTMYQYSETVPSSGWTPVFTRRTPKVGDVCYGYTPVCVCGYVTEVVNNDTVKVRDTYNGVDRTLYFVQSYVRPYSQNRNTALERCFNLYTSTKEFIMPTIAGDEVACSTEYCDLKTQYYTVANQAGTFIAPFNGYFYATGRATAASQYIGFYGDSNYTRYEQWGGSGDEIVVGPIYLSRGQRLTDIRSNFVSADTGKEVRFYKAKGNGDLYFYVGDTADNVNLINVSDMANSLAGKMDSSKIKRYVTETGSSATAWFEIYNDKWCICYGYGTATTDAHTTINLPVTFASNNYRLGTTSISSRTDMNSGHSDWVTVKNTSNFTWHCDSYGGTVEYIACGYIA